MTGKQFGELFVVERVENGPYNALRWACRCSCGKESIVYGAALRNGTTLSCGCLLSRKGKDNPNWQGGVFVDAKGYRCLSNHKGKQVREHRVIMEEFLGRKLFVDENVHHKNGNKADNRIENLELWATNQPAGQRVEDKVVYAIEILKKYAPEVLK